MRMALALALVPSWVMAQPFVEVGVGAYLGCIYQGYQSQVIDGRINTNIDCSRNPLGIVAVGYQLDSRFRVQIEHLSSGTHKDRGMEMLSLRYRYVFDWEGR